MELIKKLKAEKVFFSITWVTGARKKRGLDLMEAVNAMSPEVCNVASVEKKWFYRNAYVMRTKQRKRGEKKEQVQDKEKLIYRPGW